MQGRHVQLDFRVVQIAVAHQATGAVRDFHIISVHRSGYLPADGHAALVYRVTAGLSLVGIIGNVELGRGDFRNHGLIGRVRTKEQFLGHRIGHAGNGQARNLLEFLHRRRGSAAIITVHVAAAQISQIPQPPL